MTNDQDCEIKDSLTIEILGYGLGLNGAHSDSLLANSVKEFNSVVSFAFDSMVKGHNEAQSVYEIEVVPWAYNAEFLHLAGVDESRITVPKTRGLIENSITIIDAFGNTNTVCLSIYSVPDGFGKCCHVDDIETITQTDAEGNKIEKDSCKPTHHLSSSTLMKVNIATNAEFVSWMGSVATEKINTLSSLSQCASAIRTFLEQYDYHFLHDTDKAKYGDAIEMEFTVKELKAILDPTHNLESISIIGDEHEEYFEMFYQPCMSAIYGLNIGNDNTIDKCRISKSFMP